MTADAVGRIETLRPVPAESNASEADSGSANDNSSWWSRYSHAASRLPPATMEILETDATYIAEHAVPQVGDFLDEAAFGASRVRTGIVVGSVQSGKTASMLAVAALLLDKGIDILVVLAGTRVSLWLQTYERLLDQLDGSDLYSAWKRSADRALVPQPEDVLASIDRVDPSMYLLGARSKVRIALRAGKPVIFVVPKEDDHLLALGRFLEVELLQTSGADRPKPTTMVVLDDEADDASVLDSIDGRKITPKFIQRLWSSAKSLQATRHERLFATYIAYTATPQANYLQTTHNPLSPRDFHAALRLPGDRGQKSPRTLTYTEPAGQKAYYTGGEFYYERFMGLAADPCIAYPFPEPLDPSDIDEEPSAAALDTVRWQMIGDALRSYLVAGAARVLLSGRRLPKGDEQPMPREQLDALLPPTHSMLYHPSALKYDQFLGAADIVRWSQGATQVSNDFISDESEWDTGQQLDASGLTRRLAEEEPLWEKWLGIFKRSAAGLSTLPGQPPGGLQAVTWAEVKYILNLEIFPNVKVRVLNSDPRAGDRPQFSPQLEANGLFLPPRDLLTIFVAGNVLSRGLTIEGLCTSLFVRSAREPAADTQMQMQRWFGYRGSYFAFCRVFAFADQLKLFRQYHSNDQAMKSEILVQMEDKSAPSARGALVLQGMAFKATSKVESKRVPLHPGPSPSVRLLEPHNGAMYSENLQLLDELLKREDWDYLEYPQGNQRGLIGSKPIAMLEVASLLERLRYSSHDPDPTLELSKRWGSLQRLLNWPEPFFRPPGIRPTPMAVGPSGCPYSIAAYLRLWAAALEQPSSPGLMPTDDPSTPWNRINVSEYRATVPRFYVGVRFGVESSSKVLKFRGRSFPMMRRGLVEGRDDLLSTLWGSRNPSEKWLGDQLFDYHLHNTSGAPKLLDESSWRPRGHPGLLLFHVVADPVTGSETVALGLAIPHGGPDHVAALREEQDG
ncbi:Z1 domain protein [Hydrogenophaga sp. RAC07]|uniref:Z1 domain-containing protein n=1 Tax=Hydrogenophaga sp. RAC07 TaxID=1842537 RepID=UPI0008588ADD|nr:Z1 domain-containing protein [Hydrogenophaga sp. RAC07]AOF84815.1 Z1 domain protein [Hydrogenophaga sp. RAC07]